MPSTNSSQQNSPASWFEVHVFGSNTQGEGVVLKLPGEQYALIDCCFDGLSSEPDKNPVLSFLNARGVRQLAFLCLTHPHRDHYYGLEQVLDQISTKVFIYPSALEVARLARLLKVEDALLASQGTRRDRDKFASYVRVMQKLIGDRSCEKCRCSPGQAVFPRVLPRHPQFTLTATSPFDVESDAYEVQVARCFVDGKLDIAKLKGSNIDHNRISVGLLFESDAFSVMLGGDVLKANWVRTLPMFPDRLDSVLVKASHHGSDTGICDGLLQSLSSQGQAVFCITGFATSKIPEQSMIDAYRNAGSSVHLTHLHNTPAGVTPRERSAQAVRTAFSATETGQAGMQAMFSAHPVPRPAYGCWSYFFSRNGLERVSRNQFTTLV